MPALTIKNIPDELYRTLKESAKAHHRSMNGEVIACLERTLGTGRIDPETFLARVGGQQEQGRIRRLTDRLLGEAKERGRA